jgi:hypothetical protein
MRIQNLQISLTNALVMYLYVTKYVTFTNITMFIFNTTIFIYIYKNKNINHFRPYWEQL